MSKKRGCLLGILQGIVFACITSLLLSVIGGLVFWQEMDLLPQQFGFVSAAETVIVAREEPIVYQVDAGVTVAATPVTQAVSDPRTGNAYRYPATPTVGPEPTLTPSPTLTPIVIIIPTVTPAPIMVGAVSNKPAAPPQSNPVPPAPAVVADGPAAQNDGATRLVIPKMGLDTPILPALIVGETWDVSQLDQEVGHLERTASPGTTGNVVLAGHITLEPDGRPGPFINLGYLVPGDEITVYQGDRAFTYQVIRMTTVKPTDVHITYPTDEARLTMITCLNYNHDVGHYEDRLVVISRLVE